MSGKPSRKLTKRLQDKHRDSIATSAILNRLKEHTLADGDIMTTSQVAAARLLLGKTMPDLKAIEVSGDMDINHAILSKEELKARIKAFKEENA